MREIRVSVSKLPPPGSEVELSPEEAHHVRDVLRLKPGASIVLLDGAGGKAPALVCSVTKQRVSVRVFTCEAAAPRALPVTLAVALIKRGFEDVVRQAVEIGIERIVPLVTERCVPGLKLKRERCLRVAREAAKQSGNVLLPVLENPVDLRLFASRFQGLGRARCLLAAQPGAPLELLQAALQAEPPFAIVIGPEGGLTEAELERLLEAGFKPAALGETVLRTETAACAAAALLASVCRLKAVRGGASGAEDSESAR